VVTIGQTAAFFALMMMLVAGNKRAAVWMSSAASSDNGGRHGNPIDYSRGVVFTRWGRLGIFSLARIASGGASPTVQTEI